MPRCSNSERILDRYVAEIGAFPLLDRAAEQDLARRYRQLGDMAAGKRLIVGNLRFVVKVAHQYKGYGIALGDLIQEGNLGLMHAIKKFDPDRGYRLISYAVWWIRAAIQNYVLRSYSLVKMGTTQTQRKLFFQLRAAKDKLTRDGGDLSALSESLAAELGVPQQDIAAMEMRLAVRDLSLDDAPSEGIATPYIEVLADTSRPSLEEAYADAQQHAFLKSWLIKLLARFNDRERYIIQNRLMAAEPQTLRQVGDHFHISRERARQIEGNVLRKMRLQSAALQGECR